MTSTPAFALASSSRWRRSLIAGAFTLAALVARRARAQDPEPIDLSEDISDERREAYRSSQDFALSLRMGPYYPGVDNEFGNGKTGPHHDYFGSSSRLLGHVDFEWQILHTFGTLALGASVGYFKENAESFVEPTTPDQTLTLRSSDNTSLTLLPTSVSAIYRFDVAARWWHVPIVPYGRVGLDYDLWFISGGDGKIASSGSARGRGGTLGWHAGVGVAILLDALDPASAQALDAETGINHTYLFGELTHYRIDGLGQSNVLELGDTTWSAGVMVEF